MKETSHKLFIYIARIIAAYFALVDIGSYIWFIDNQNMQTTVYFIATLIALCVFAFLPRRLLIFNITRKAIGVLAVLALVFSVPIMINDLTNTYGPHYPAFALRLLVCGLVVLMVWEARRNKRGNSLQAFEK